MIKNSNHFDYVFLGGGMSSLLLVYRMAGDTFFDDKSILILDREAKNTNDRTWSYWEKGAGEWDDILAKKWNKIKFTSTTFDKTLSLGDYHFKSIESSGFYEKIKRRIASKRNIVTQVTNITAWKVTPDLVRIMTTAGDFTASMAFNSILDANKLFNNKNYPYLKQHFVGWFIETAEDTFDEEVATFMDFDITQGGNTRFIYVLPYGKKKALVEYTLFSADLLAYAEYESEIQNYLEKKGINNYHIYQKEVGNIPMSCAPLHEHNTENMVFVGSAGGWTKPSTGFTFYNSNVMADKIIKGIKNKDILRQAKPNAKFRLYDMIFIDVLYKRNDLGWAIFTDMFRNNDITLIFKWLDERTTFGEDIKVMTSIRPLILFTKMALLRWKDALFAIIK